MKKPLSILIICFLSLFCYNEAFATSFMAGGFRLNKKVKSMKEIKSENVIHQSLDFSCGAAGLSTVMNFYLNDPISEKEIINSLLQIVDLAKVKARKGFSLLDLKKFAESKGYKATGYKMDMEFLKELNKPVLVPIKFKNYRHFVIVRGIVGDRVFIADPAAGKMVMKDVRFENIWLNGIGLVVEREGYDEGEYALKVKEEEALFADYKHVARSLPGTAIRTAVFPDEFVNR